MAFDLKLELNDICDAGCDNVAGADWADAAGSSGEDDVAALKSEVLGNCGDESRNVENHVTRGTALTILGIHFQP